jgi:hypothetical protein
VQPSPEEQRSLGWSHFLITFDGSDHPDGIIAVGTLHMVVSPIIKNVRVSKMLVDGGASLKIL